MVVRGQPARGRQKQTKTAETETNLQPINQPLPRTKISYNICEQEFFVRIIQLPTINIKFTHW